MDLNSTPWLGHVINGVLGLLVWSLSRNVKAMDLAISNMNAAMGAFSKELVNLTVSILPKVQVLEEARIRTERQLGQLEGQVDIGLTKVTERVDGMSKYYHEEFRRLSEERDAR